MHHNYSYGCVAAGVNSDWDFGLTRLSSWSSERFRERETEWHTNRRVKTDIETERNRDTERVSNWTSSGDRPTDREAEIDRQTEQCRDRDADRQRD